MRGHEGTIYGTTVGYNFREVGYETYNSRGWLCAAERSVDGNPGGENMLVGRREIGTLSQTEETVGAMHRMASGGHSRAYRTD